MKTLDEVIEAQERCETYPNCHFCYLHSGPMCEWIRDALQYLKWYKELADDSEAYAEWKENPPLTWDELKSMEGKPVWIEDGLENGEWCIIECFTESGRFIAHDRYADDTVFKAIDMGNMWQAYRKERHESTDRN